ncbi:hypothetical protein C1A40_08675 [Tamlana carrageenivorans]|uniref:Uncharacterized protein n=2 Tax=Pseudotamlana carrageenivorans TaxID=2069432 RepID=A0A2I7SHY9_9FLAO|nr:hypothetical protein C1A40_08675 [Tamlana carrageenivorans]
MWSCKSSEHGNEKGISKTRKSIKIDKFEYLKNGDTLSYTEVRFYRVHHTAFYSQKVMFDKFGKWDQMIFYDYERGDLLLWKDLKLFEDDATRYTIAALGEETIETLYASFMAFDEKGNDLLKDTLYQEKLIPYFHRLIKSGNYHNRTFFDVYDKEVKANKLTKSTTH